MKHIDVFKYENLTVAKALEFAKSYNEVWKYLPIEKEIAQLPRQYIMNVIYSVVGEPFSTWVTEECEKRDTLMKEKTNQLLELDSDIA